MNKTIEIIIGTAGEIQIDAVGFKGPDCEEATQFLEEALGVVGQKIKKPEYHQRSTSQKPAEDWRVKHAGARPKRMAGLYVSPVSLQLLESVRQARHVGS